MDEQIKHLVVLSAIFFGVSSITQAGKGFFRERKHPDSSPSKNIANNGKGMYVSLKQLHGDGERCMSGCEGD